MPRNYWRSKSQRSRRSFEPERVKPPVDPLYDAARAASTARNLENYAWVADWSPSDTCPADAVRRKLAHVERLICLVGEADKAWRAYAESKGEPYKPCVDCGWLPRYTSHAEALRAELASLEVAS